MQPDTKPELRQRREALGLSREKLARQADCAAITIEMLEGGWRPKQSRVFPALLATLDRLEAQKHDGPVASEAAVKLGAGAADHGTAG